MHTYETHLPGVVARIYRPELSEDERARRMKSIHDAAARLIRAAAQAERGEKIHG